MIFKDKKINLKDIILGGQDGLVNVLGIILGVAIATQSTVMVLIAGLSATWAESISMGAVAYTSSKAARDYYKSIKKKTNGDYDNPLKSGLVVFASAFIGSLIPLSPFPFMKVNPAVITSIIVSITILFVTGALKARVTIGSWKRSGIEMVLIGLGAVISGYLIGLLLNYIFGVQIAGN